MSLTPEYIFFAVFAAVTGYMLYQIFTKGLKSALFGGRIEKTYGEIDLEKQNMMSRKLKGHRVSSKDGNRVGIEIVHKSVLSYQMAPVTLNKQEAQRLIHLLTLAANES